MRVFLTGFMGSGKTTVGRLLAERLAMPFIDLDHEIEAGTGCSVREIFAEGGEPLFRRIEREALLAALETPDAVLATGGGTLTQEANRRLLEGRGVSLWLNPPFSVLVERIGALGREDRPLFQTEEQALELYRSRLPFYRRAEIELSIEARETPEEVAARAALLLKGAK